VTKGSKSVALGPNDRNAWTVSEAHADLVRAPRPPRPVSLAAEPKPCTIDLARTAMIVIDMQNDFCHPKGWLASIGVDVAPARAPIMPLMKLLPVLRKHGTPAHPSALREHECVRLAGPIKPGWAFQDGGRKLHVAVDGALDFNHAGAALRACENGLGFGQFFSYQVQDALRERRLRVVLAAFEPARLPVSIVYPHARLLPARTRAFIDAARRELAPLFN